MKSFIRRLFYTNAPFRSLVGWCSMLLGRTKPMHISHLLSYRENDAIGPLQRDEAIALFGIIRTLRPQVVVEFGFFHGHSAFNFLQALTENAQLYSYDIDSESIQRAKSEFSFDKRFHFIGKSQTDFAPEDIGHQKIDFVFFDAAHELDLNIQTFQRIIDQLDPEAMLAVHDTGLWQRAYFSPIHETFTREMPGEWETEDLYAHQPGERKFMDWIVTEYPEFSVLHFHSSRTLRHGFSLLQRKRQLSHRGYPDAPQVL
jgi:Methyltransferase domain